MGCGMKKTSTKNRKTGKAIRDAESYLAERYRETDSKTKKAIAYGHRKPYAGLLIHKDKDSNADTDRQQGAQGRAGTD